jgi:hypothetical protein
MPPSSTLRYFPGRSARFQTSRIQTRWSRRRHRPQPIVITASDFPISATLRLMTLALSFVLRTEQLFQWSRSRCICGKYKHKSSLFVANNYLLCLDTTTCFGRLGPSLICQYNIAFYLTLKYFIKHFRQ